MLRHNLIHMTVILYSLKKKMEIDIL